MKDFTLLAEDAGVRADIVLPIPSNADPTHFPGSISARTGTLLLAIRSEAMRSTDRSADDDGSDDESPDIELTTQAWLDLENELLGEAGAARLAELNLSPYLRDWVISVLTVWHLLGPESGRQAWDAGPSSGKATAPATSPKTAGRSSKAGTSGRSPAKARASTTRQAGASSSPQSATRARRTA